MRARIIIPPPRAQPDIQSQASSPQRPPRIHVNISNQKINLHTSLRITTLSSPLVTIISAAATTNTVVVVVVVAVVVAGTNI